MRILGHFVMVPVPRLALVTLALIAGISAQAYEISFILRYSGVVFCSAIGLVTVLQKQLYWYLCLCFFCSLSFVWGGYWYSKKVFDYTTVAQSVSGPGMLKGTVRDVEERNRGLYKQVITVALEDAYTISSLGTYTVKLYMRQPLVVSLGNTLRYTKELSWAAPLKKGHSAICRGLVASYFVHNNDALEVMNTTSLFWRWKGYWARARSRLVEKIQAHLSREAYRFFALVFLGAGDYDEHTIRQRFSYWGITHYLARSGLHVTLVLALWQSIMRFLPVKLLVKRIFLLIILALYTLLSWSSISFVRAALSYTLSQLYTIASVQTHPLHAITLTCFLVLLYNPLYLFSISFQLSFVLAFALTWLRYVELLRRRMHTNQHLPGLARV